MGVEDADCGGGQIRIGVIADESAAFGLEFERTEIAGDGLIGLAGAEPDSDRGPGFLGRPRLRRWIIVKPSAMRKRALAFRRGGSGGVAGR